MKIITDFYQLQKFRQRFADLNPSASSGESLKHQTIRKLQVYKLDLKQPNSMLRVKLISTVHK